MIQLSRPSITSKDIKQVSSVLRSGMLVQGRFVRILEEEMSKYLSVRNVICVSSGTATLHLSLIALGIGFDEEVIVPAFSFIATANVVELVGAKPIFVDIGLSDFNIDASKIESEITPKTRAIMPVHEFGLSADMESVAKVAYKRKLNLIEDAACAIGAEFNNNKVGSFGDLGSFSFHPRKAITSGEGGVLVTNNDELSQKLKVLRSHGIIVTDGKTEFVEAGFNYRLTDFQAALVLGQFHRLDEIITKRQMIAEMYFEEIKSNKVILPSAQSNKKHSWQSFHVLLEDQKTRDGLLNYLKARGVQSNYGAQCIPHMTYYRNKYGFNSEKNFPNAYRAYTCGLAIPIYDTLSKKKAKYICKLINKF